MNCPRCQAQVLADDVNLDHLVAKCRQCHDVFRVDPAALGPPPASARPAGVTAPRPDNMRVEEWGDERRLTWRWFNWGYLLLLFFCIAWDSFLCFWYSVALGFSDDGSGGGFELLMVIFPIAHVAVGVGLTYTTVAGFLNRTEITARGDRLTVRHGPLPWPGGLDVPAADVKQIYCTRAMQHRRRAHYYDGTWPDWYHVDLHVLLADGSQRKVLGYISRAEGIFLEQQIEHWLGIANRPVPGEVG